MRHSSNDCLHFTNLKLKNGILNGDLKRVYWRQLAQCWGTVWEKYLPLRPLVTAWNERWWGADADAAQAQTCRNSHHNLPLWHRFLSQTELAAQQPEKNSKFQFQFRVQSVSRFLVTWLREDVSEPRHFGRMWVMVFQGDAISTSLHITTSPSNFFYRLYTNKRRASRVTWHPCHCTSQGTDGLDSG
jgi:hypothetical protein